MSVVVPCYNEEAVIELTHGRLIDTLGSLTNVSLELIYVNDGSRDRTGTILAGLAAKDPRVKHLTLSRNFGHQPAVSAGLAHAEGDAIVVLDADLQDPPDVVLSMLDRWRDGFDIVYGIRQNRQESIIKRASYAIFYRIFHVLTNIDAPLDSGDFCLIDRRALDELNRLPEKMRFFRGLRSWIGFRQTGIAYQRATRAAGRSKYSYLRLAKLGMDGIFNFSTVPLTLVFIVGLFSSIFAALALIFIILQRVFDIEVYGVRPENVPGFATLALIILFIGGIQLTSLGILGEYIGRIYQEVKGRPTFLVQSVQQASAPQAEEREPASTRHL